MRLIDWITPLSDYSELYFERLSDEGDAEFVVSTGVGSRYVVMIPGDNPFYAIVDDEHLTRYCDFPRSGRLSPTLEVVDSGLLKWFFPHKDPFVKLYRHFVIWTYDGCLEVISDKEPRIEKLNQRGLF